MKTSAFLAALDKFARAVDAVNARAGKSAAWLYPILVTVVVVNVILRYVFSLGLIEFEEIQWHLYAAAFLLAYAYTYVEDAHVRVDIFHYRLSPTARAWIELLGCLVLLFPFAAVVAWFSFDFFWESWILREASDMPSGLPARYVIKFILSASLVMLGLQALSTAAKSFLIIVKYRA